MPRIGIMVFGHGSSVASANDAVRAVAANAARDGSWPLYETAFLECDPKLDAAVEALARSGAEEVLVLPYFLTLGIHLQRDCDPGHATARRPSGAGEDAGRSGR